MDNFLGYGTASSSYDARRHVNLMFYTMIMLRLTKNDNSFIKLLKRVLESGYDRNTRSAIVCNQILTQYETSYLNYLKERYGLSDDEFLTIVSGELLKLKEIKSPAGYQGPENWKLIIQMFYATALSGREYQGYVQKLVSEFFYPFCAGMRGITLTQSTFRLISENMNICLNQGKRLFADLPYIEQFVMTKIV